jgi:hypothetical protein
VRPEGLGQLKNPMTSGIEPATFRLVAHMQLFAAKNILNKSCAENEANVVFSAFSP